MKYCVYITELHYGSVHVEADSDSDAVRKGEALYKQGHVLWHDGELSDVTPRKDIGRVVVTRPVNGISLNSEREFLLDDRGEIKEFDSVEQAQAFLTVAGIEPEELRHMKFIQRGVD